MQLRVTFERFVPWFARVALALIFIWFGALKIVGVSPVASVIEQAMPFLTRSPALYAALGWFELLVGLGILIPRITRIVAWLMVVHLTVATLSVLFSAQSWSGGFPMLSVVGEFVVKNAALIAVALFLIVCAPKRK